MIVFLQLWDLAAGKVMSTLTHHKKAVRSLTAHPKVCKIVDVHVFLTIFISHVRN